MELSGSLFPGYPLFGTVSIFLSQGTQFPTLSRIPGASCPFPVLQLPILPHVGPFTATHSFLLSYSCHIGEVGRTCQTRVEA